MNLRTFLRSLIASIGALFVSKLPKKPEYKVIKMGGARADWATMFSDPSADKLLRARVNCAELVDKAVAEKLKRLAAGQPWTRS